MDAVDRLRAAEMGDRAGHTQLYCLGELHSGFKREPEKCVRFGRALAVAAVALPELGCLHQGGYEPILNDTEGGLLWKSRMN